MALLKAITGFIAPIGGGTERAVSKGEVLDEKDPIVKGREVFFEPLTASVARGPLATAVVEQATAAPGEKRAVRTRTQG